MRTKYLLLLSVMLFWQCASTYKSQNKLRNVTPMEITIDRSARMDQKTDRVNIKSARQIGDILVLDVSYAGGCAEHDFNLLTNGKYKSSYPPEIEIKLIHDNNDDGCRAVIDKKLYFNLTPLQYDGTTQVLLVVKNSEKTLQYNY